MKKKIKFTKRNTKTLLFWRTCKSYWSKHRFGNLGFLSTTISRIFLLVSIWFNQNLHCVHLFSKNAYMSNQIPNKAFLFWTQRFGEYLTLDLIISDNAFKICIMHWGYMWVLFWTKAFWLLIPKKRKNFWCF